MPRPLLTTSLERSFLLTKRLLTHHLLLQEYMPDLPLLREAGVDRSRGARTGIRFLEPLHPEPIEAGVGESGLPAGVEGVAVAALETRDSAPGREADPTVQAEPPQHDVETTVPPSSSQSPAPFVVSPAQQAAEPEAPPRPRRPWRQRIAEVDTGTEAQPVDLAKPDVEAMPIAAESVTPSHPISAAPSAVEHVSVEASRARTGGDSQVVPSTREQPLSAPSPPMPSRPDVLPEAVEERPTRTAAATTGEEARVDAAGQATEQPLVVETDSESRATVRAVEGRESSSPIVKQNADGFQTEILEEARAAEVEVDSDTVSAEGLFVGKGQDRSPQSWIARLTGARRPASATLPMTPPSGKTQATVRPTPEPTVPPSAEETSLRETSRRFLRPLVGIDPAEARIHQGPIAEQVTAALYADAITVGDSVFLGAGQDEGTPAGLGVLAHELTHVARNRRPDFVPPIARSAERSLGQEGSPTVPPVSDEETLATTVEAHVRTAADQTRQAEFAAVGEPPALTVEPGAVPDVSPAQTLERRRPAVPMPPQGQTNWGGLPAPWEPLPDWVVTPPAATTSESVPTVGDAYAPGGAGTEIQRAGEERSLEAPAETATAAHPAATPEADLDRLAQQVYARLKQRLSAERRREWR